MKISKTCCFTGHRPEKLYINGEDELTVYNKIYAAVRDAALDGYVLFMCGASRGGDFLFGEAVIALKSEFPELELNCVLPCRTQSASWDNSDRGRYADLLDASSAVICLHDEYTRSCMHERNQYMVDRSSLLIAAFNGSDGGTKSTVAYAGRRGLRTVNVLTPPRQETEQLSFL